ncbi:MAG: hypothetical protein FJ243_03335 [Nitrospira sp.]|nr:hypothetical protein [Nitrospira sp.]
MSMSHHGPDRVMNVTYAHRYEGLVEYIARNYRNAVEIGIGHFPDVAYALLEKGVKVFATDVKPYRYRGLKVIVDDVTRPDLSLYDSRELLYSLRPPPELVPYMERLAKMFSADLIVKPLSSEYLSGQFNRYGDTTFFFWSSP